MSDKYRPLNTCDERHSQIVYYGERGCPICPAFKNEEDLNRELTAEINDLKDETERLYNQIKHLELLDA